MISHKQRPHKSAGMVLVLVLLLLPMFLLAGCSGSQEESPDTQATGKTAGSDCEAQVDRSSWHALVTLGDRAFQGESIPLEDLTAFGDLSVVTAWRESMTPRSPSARKVGNWVESAFWDQLGNGREEKKSGDRYTFGTSFRFSYDNREAIETVLDRFENEGHICNTLEMARFWLEPDLLPDPFVVHFLAGKPELRSHHGQLMADTGLLLAGGPQQLSRQLVGILYRDRQGLQGPSPLEVEGRESVAHTLRTMMNEGIAGWIDDMPHTHFSDVHPRLRKVSFVPENVYNIGIRAIDIFNTNLPRLLADEATMQGSGQGIGRAITGAGAFTQGGYCMAAVIAHHLGEERLHSVRLSPPLFLAAFQEAALQNTLPLPVPGTPGTVLPECMPPLEEGVFQGLMEILEEHFPTG